MTWLTVASHVILKHRRHRMQWALLAFVALVFGTAVLFSSLSYGTPYRAVADVGAFGAEGLAVMAAIFGLVLFITEDLEGRGAILMLAKPLPRSSYLVGWFAGFAGGLFFLLAAMLGFLYVLEAALGGSLEAVVAWEFWMIYLKILMTVSFSLMLSMVVTSLPMSLVGLASTYLLGHLVHYLKDLARPLPFRPLFWLTQVLDILLPAFHRLEALDSALVGSFSAQAAFMGTLYAVSYSSAALCFAVMLFQRREF